MNIGYTVEGMNFAIASGVAAAKTVLDAKEHRDFSKKRLQKYAEILHQDFVLQDLTTFRRAPAFLRNPNIYNIYPDILTNIAEDLITSRGIRRKRLLNVIIRNWRKRASLLTLVRDGIQAVRAI